MKTIVKIMRALFFLDTFSNTHEYKNATISKLKEEQENVY